MSSVAEVEDISAVVLGCTHFIYFTDLFHRLVPDRPIFNGISGTASHVIKTLGVAEALATHRACSLDVMSHTEFYVSGKLADEKSLEGFRNCLELISRIKKY